MSAVPFDMHFRQIDDALIMPTSEFVLVNCVQNVRFISISQILQNLS